MPCVGGRAAASSPLARKKRGSIDLVASKICQPYPGK